MQYLVKWVCEIVFSFWMFLISVLIITRFRLESNGYFWGLHQGVEWLYNPKLGKLVCVFWLVQLAACPSVDYPRLTAGSASFFY